MPGYKPFFWEVLLSQAHWENIPADLATWYEYNYSHESRLKRQRILSEIIPIVRKIIAEQLTDRQRQVVILYFAEQCTQVQVAERLAISQPTVSQHLTGKRRGGKKIGGALRRIRKTIRRQAAHPSGDTEGVKMLLILDGLLDENMTHRAAAQLLDTVE